MKDNKFYCLVDNKICSKICTHLIKLNCTPITSQCDLVLVYNVCDFFFVYFIIDLNGT